MVEIARRRIAVQAQVLIFPSPYFSFSLSISQSFPLFSLFPSLLSYKSGGSVSIIANSCNGGGMIQANAGNANPLNGYGGGGGRISIECNTDGM